MLKAIFAFLLCLAGISPVTTSPASGDTWVLHVMDTVVRVDVADGHGSGSCVWVDSTGDGFFLTAKHVAGEEGMPVELKGFVDGAVILEQAVVISVSPKVDLSLLRSHKTHFAAIQLGDQKDYTGRMSIACGFPGPIFPAVLSLGLTLKTEDYEIGRFTRFTSAIFFGNSGGPLVDFKTGRLIGVTVWVWGRFPSDPECISNTGGAVPLEDIREFIGWLQPN